MVRCSSSPSQTVARHKASYMGPHASRGFALAMCPIATNQLTGGEKRWAHWSAALVPLGCLTPFSWPGASCGPVPWGSSQWCLGHCCKRNVARFLFPSFDFQVEIQCGELYRKMLALDTLNCDTGPSPFSQRQSDWCVSILSWANKTNSEKFDLTKKAQALSKILPKNHGRKGAFQCC